MLTRGGVSGGAEGKGDPGQLGSFSPLASPGQDTRRTRAERESGQNSGARRVDRMSLPLFAGRWTGSNAGPMPGGRWVKGHSFGGNAKTTFGILSVSPGRDLFSS